MTIRKNIPSTQFSLTQRGVVITVALAGLAGCSLISSVLEPDRINYKSAGKVTAPKLDVPPDLTQLQRENRYAIPNTKQGTSTAFVSSLEQGAGPAPAAATIAPDSAATGMHIERDGSQRWLVINATTESLWPKVKDFWKDSGFLINIENSETGTMETDWAENRAKIPQDFFRNTLGKVFDSIYSTGERDKFRTRLERGLNGTTEIYISHRGATEVLSGAQKESSIWTARPADPQLEAELLSRLMGSLRADGVKAKAAVTNTPSMQARSKLIKNAAGDFVQVDEDFDRAWRRVGLALDRVGFTVEDRDRAKGLYFVRYVDQEADAKDNKFDKGFFYRLFSRTDGDKAKNAASYRIFIKGAESGNQSQIAVLSKDGQPELSKTSDKILVLLNEQLK